MKKLFASLVMIVVVVSCRSDLLTPPTGPNTSYPCGIGGVQCSDGLCCPPNNECGWKEGNFGTCPIGYCCYLGGDDWPGAKPDGGRPMKKATPPRS